MILKKQTKMVEINLPNNANILNIIQFIDKQINDIKVECLKKWEADHQYDNQKELKLIDNLINQRKLLIKKSEEAKLKNTTFTTDINITLKPVN